MLPYSDENNLDFFGKNFKLFDYVAYGQSCSTSTARACIGRVTEIRDGKVYLDESPQPIRFTNRLIILNGQMMYKGETFTLALQQ